MASTDKEFEKWARSQWYADLHLAGVHRVDEREIMRASRSVGPRTVPMSWFGSENAAWDYLETMAADEIDLLEARLEKAKERLEKCHRRRTRA